MKKYAALFAYTFTIYQEFYHFLPILAPEQFAELLFFFLEKQKDDIAFPVAKSSILDNNIVKFEYFKVEFQGMKVAEAIVRSGELFRRYLQALDVIKGEGFQEVKKGEWRSIDGYVIMAAEICMVRALL